MKRLVDLKLENKNKDILIGVDGGVNLDTIKTVYDTGVDITIVGSGLYKAPSIKDRFDELMSTGL